MTGHTISDRALIAGGDAVITETAPPETGHLGCLICTTDQTPAKAYRPHTLKLECWCVPGSAVNRICLMIRHYGPVIPE